LLKIKELEILCDLCKNLADKLELDTNKFNINGNEVKISFKDIEHILGPPSQGEEIKDPQKKNNMHLDCSTSTYGRILQQFITRTRRII
jgi:hypothetical protein